MPRQPGDAQHQASQRVTAEVLGQRHDFAGAPEWDGKQAVYGFRYFVQTLLVRKLL